jgi:hypothetical protein
MFKMLISINGPFYYSQESVDVKQLYDFHGIKLALHRPPKNNPNKHQLWCISDIETGTLVAKGMSQAYTEKKAKKLLEKYYETFLIRKEKYLNVVAGQQVQL